jgi:hypothetical protein
MIIEITPELLADWQEKAQSYVEWENVKGKHEHPRYFSDKASFEQIATPDVVLALVDEIKRLNERFDEQKLLATRMIEHAAEQKKEMERLRDRLEELECPNCGNQPKFCMCDVEQPEASNADQA